VRKFVSGQRRRRAFDNKSLKVIGGMGITCRRGWGAKWNEVENHLRKMRSYVIRRRGWRRNENLLLPCVHYSFEINEKKMNPGVGRAGVFCFFSLVFLYPLHMQGGWLLRQAGGECIRARMDKMLNDPENIHTRSGVTTEDKFVSLC